MAGESDITQNTLLICKGQELTMSPTIKAGYIIWGANPIPAISKHPREFLYGWLPLSNAYRYFQSQNVALNWLPHGIYFINNLVIYPNMNEGDNNPIVPPNTPRRGIEPGICNANTQITPLHSLRNTSHAMAW